MLTWKEKIRLTHCAVSECPELAIVFAVCQGADEDFLSYLRQAFPFIDDEYVSFLRETDGVQIDMYQLFGSGRSGFTSISEGMKQWKPIIGNDGIAIGEDPSGDCIVIGKDGRVRLVDYRMQQSQDGRIMAESFPELVGDVLMGPSFPKVFPNGRIPAHENEWTRFLRRQGWL